MPLDHNISNNGRTRSQSFGLLKKSNLTSRRAYKSGTSFGVGPTAARYLILVLLTVFSLMYLIQSAQGSDALIRLQSLTNNESNLNQEMTSLQVNATRLQSLQNLSQSASKEGLVPIDGSVDGITVSNPAN